jgi:hypothetical protein
MRPCWLGWLGSVPKARTSSAQGNALGSWHQTICAIQSPERTPLDSAHCWREEHPESRIALSGLWEGGRVTARNPGRCPGLRRVVPLAHQSGGTPGWIRHWAFGFLSSLGLTHSSFGGIAAQARDCTTSAMISSVLMPSASPSKERRMRWRRAAGATAAMSSRATW